MNLHDDVLSTYSNKQLKEAIVKMADMIALRTMSSHVYVLEDLVAERKQDLINQHEGMKAYMREMGY